MTVSKHIIVRGRVQGVGYRYATRHAVAKRNITGNVKNLPDGSVEIYATGNEQDVADLIQWCHNGPVRARVTNVMVTDLPLQSFQSFSIL